MEGNARSNNRWKNERDWYGTSSYLKT